MQNDTILPLKVPFKKRHYGIGHISRLKSRFLAGKTTRTEILELLLSYVIKGRDVKGESKALYTAASGSFKKVFSAVEKGGIPGLGAETATFFKVLRAFMDGHSSDGFTGKKFRAGSQREVADYFRNACHDRDREAVFALFLDAKNRIMGMEMVSEGTLMQSLLYPREIVASCMSRGAAGLIMIHNHPSGDPSPSENDRKVTQRLLFATREMDITFLDHLVIGTEGKGYYSFHEDGLMAHYNGNYRILTENMGM